MGEVLGKKQFTDNMQYRNKLIKSAQIINNQKNKPTSSHVLSVRSIQNDTCTMPCVSQEGQSWCAYPQFSQ